MNEIGFYMKQIYNKMERYRNNRLDEITGTQLDTLQYLYHFPGKNTVKHIADYFSVKHTSVLHVLKNLEARNLISRNDKKTSAGRAISLTADGIAIVEKNEQGIDVLDRIAFNGFTKDEIAMFVDYLKRLNANIDNLFDTEEDSQI